MISHHLIDSVKSHEGYRNKAYQDTEGVWTIGYGCNLQRYVCTKSWAEQQLMKDLESAHKAATRFPEWEACDNRARRDAFVEMVYNLGPTGVAGFRNMLRAMREGDWVEVERQALDSKWARQVGNRAVKLAKQLRTGVYWNATTEDD